MHPLAQKETVAPEDLWDQPVIVSRQLYQGPGMERILGRNKEMLNIVATYNLMFNGSLMVEEGMGYAVVAAGWVVANFSEITLVDLVES